MSFASKQEIPWDLIKIDYCTGFQSDSNQLRKHSYDSIAKKYNIPTSSVSNKGAQENWKALRDKMEMDVNEFVLESMKNNRINQITTFDDNILTNVKMIQSIATHKMLNEDKLTGKKTLKTEIPLLDLTKIASILMNATTIRKQLFADLADKNKSEGLADFTNMMNKMERDRNERNGI